MCASEPVKSFLFVSYSPVGLLNVSTIDCQRQVIWGPIFSMTTTEAGVQICAHAPSREILVTWGRQEEMLAGFSALWGRLQSIPRCVLNWKPGPETAVSEYANRLFSGKDWEMTFFFFFFWHAPSVLRLRAGVISTGSACAQ